MQVVLVHSMVELHLPYCVLCRCRVLDECDKCEDDVAEGVFT